MHMFMCRRIDDEPVRISHLVSEANGEMTLLPRASIVQQSRAPVPKAKPASQQRTYSIPAPSASAAAPKQPAALAHIFAAAAARAPKFDSLPAGLPLAPQQVISNTN